MFQQRTRRSRAVYLAIALAAGMAPARAQIRNITVTSAASFEPGLPSPGSIASLLCTGLDGIPPLTSASTYPLPRDLAGVRVSISGIPAPLYAVAALDGYQQVNFQVPLDAAGGGPFAVIVERGSLRGTQTVITLSESPGEFFLLADGSPAIQHANYDLVTATRPVSPGETAIVYLTGLHSTVPRVTTGEAAPSDPLAIVPQWDQVATADIIRVEFAGVSVQPHFVGLVPGMAGVYQINFVVPAMLQESPAGMLLIRQKCTAFFGSCQAGGGIKTTQRSRPVRVPVRR
jgi:uncharacterized protein (TIGR03437 family)